MSSTLQERESPILLLRTGNDRATTEITATKLVLLQRKEAERKAGDANERVKKIPLKSVGGGKGEQILEAIRSIWPPRAGAKKEALRDLAEARAAVKTADGELRRLEQLLSDEQHQENASTDNIGDGTESPSGTAQAGLGSITATASGTNAESDSDKIVTEPALKPPATATADADVAPTDSDSAMGAVGDAGTRFPSAAASEDVTMQKEPGAAASAARDDAPKTSTGTTSDVKGKKRAAKTDKTVDKPDDPSGAKKPKVDEPKKAKAKDVETSALSYASLDDVGRKELQGEF
jgi:hypothetical protein